MQYNAGLFIKHKKQGHKKPPIIANFVIYNGNKRKKYPYHEYTYDYFEIPWMARLLMGKFFSLINLNEESDLSLANHELSAMMQLLLKRASDSNFITWLKENCKLMETVPFERILSISIDYVLQVSKASAEEILEVFSEIYPQFKNTIMTAARQLERKGEVKGIELGIQRNQLAIAKNMLKESCEIGLIQKVTGLSEHTIEKLRKE
ncbi:MAG: hypothetical protein BGO68_01330 [Candidatus Amoebophilus sp. 36-38]|nr:MAG: hypothetical protein BGO68_01330 [Candidatus Amoebophilus sp. 36-38]